MRREPETCQSRKKNIIGKGILAAIRPLLEGSRKEPGENVFEIKRSRKQQNIYSKGGFSIQRISSTVPKRGDWGQGTQDKAEGEGRNAGIS